MLLQLLQINLQPNEQRYIQLESEQTQRFISALDQAWVYNNTLSVPYWSEQIGSNLLSNITYVLGINKWIITTVKKKYATIKVSTINLAKYTTPEQRDKYRTQIKLNQYSLKRVEDIQPSNLTKTPSGVKDVGLNRPGMAYAANTLFSFDTYYMIHYYDIIIANTIKSMTKMAKKYTIVNDDPINYGNISKLCIDNYISNPDSQYNLEYNISDSRGRSIYGGLKRVFNPIANKDARALLKFKPVTITLADSKARQNIYLFIAELLGNKRQTWSNKALSGLVSYYNRELPDITNKHLHEYIWLDRIYRKLDTLFSKGIVEWDIPIEIDMTASIAGITGILFNDERLMDKTNILYSNNIQDFWHIEGVVRDGVKAIGTPIGYGSSKSFKELLKTKSIELDKQQLRQVTEEFRSGAFSIIKQSKDFWSRNANITTPSYEVTIWNETFTVEVNKFKSAGTELTAHLCYDTQSNSIKPMVMHTPITIPDYARFKTYFTTGLIHNLDSKLLDNTLQQCTGDPVIGIHDAILCLPTSVAREEYIKQLEQLREDRWTVLSNYKKSLNISGTKAEVQWAKLLSSVQQAPINQPIAQSVMK